MPCAPKLPICRVVFNPPKQAYTITHTNIMLCVSTQIILSCFSEENEQLHRQLNTSSVTAKLNKFQITIASQQLTIESLLLEKKDRGLQDTSFRQFSLLPSSQLRESTAGSPDLILSFEGHYKGLVSRIERLTELFNKGREYQKFLLEGLNKSKRMNKRLRCRAESLEELLMLSEPKNETNIMDTEPHHTAPANDSITQIHIEDDPDTFAADLKDCMMREIIADDGDEFKLYYSPSQDSTTKTTQASMITSVTDHKSDSIVAPNLVFPRGTVQSRKGRKRNILCELRKIVATTETPEASVGTYPLYLKGLHEKLLRQKLSHQREVQGLHAIIAGGMADQKLLKAELEAKAKDGRAQSSEVKALRQSVERILESNRKLVLSSQVYCSLSERYPTMFYAAVPMTPTTVAISELKSRSDNGVSCDAATAARGTEVLLDDSDSAKCITRNNSTGPTNYTTPSIMIAPLLRQLKPTFLSTLLSHATAATLAPAPDTRMKPRFASQIVSVVATNTVLQNATTAITPRSTALSVAPRDTIPTSPLPLPQSPKGYKPASTSTRIIKLKEKARVKILNNLGFKFTRSHFIISEDLRAASLATKIYQKIGSNDPEQCEQNMEDDVLDNAPLPYKDKSVLGQEEICALDEFSATSACDYIGSVESG